MGIEIEPLPVHGDDCLECIPDLFIEGEVPKFVTATFLDIQSCPGKSPPWGTYILEQDPPRPCYWFLDALPAVYCSWYLSPILSVLRIYTYQSGPLEYSFSSSAGPCIVDFVNGIEETDCGVGYIGWGGTGKITWV